MSVIQFDTTLAAIGSATILRLPKAASARLPSRGMVMVAGTINDVHFETALEPDGKGSHWAKLDKSLLAATHAAAGGTVRLAIEPIADCPEPKVPADLQKALKSSPSALALWQAITPMARWDWIRWISSTKNPDTRKKRIAVELSKLNKGDRRPCCFNRSMCCDPDVSKNGVLLEPTPTTPPR